MASSNGEENAESTPPSQAPGGGDWYGDLQAVTSDTLESVTSFFSLPDGLTGEGIRREDGENLIKGYVNQAVEAVTTTVDEGAKWASSVFKDVRTQATAQKTAYVDPALRQACHMVSVARELEVQAIGRIRKHYCWAYEQQPELVAFTSFAALVLAFPGTRRMVVRGTLRLRSQEGLYKRVSQQNTVLAQSVDLQLQETRKLLDRTKVATEEFVRTQKKLKDARNQLDSLQSRLYKTDKSVWGLLDDLSLIKTKEFQKQAQSLQTEVAAKKDEIRKQTKLVQKAIKDIAATAGI
ncbi:hypothetical protein HOP50_12g67600 [Chloropicon primus]|uniref:Uncharacterized protein n=1 Tax=Chloropicon primus TaxID=1764295 RepID=A0A5B8MUK2_9CHLO|nr:hypothetical protein A3770_12p67410 [Chloropicon primus]UPR03431.1 hypothetical protein HOP50_12g67600 [Chloropicon primus]|eukprot:QDZ24223.1 hypothetical protein A3770_12p67410 [Chloropicon primus]